MEPIPIEKKTSTASAVSAKKHDRAQYDIIVKRNLFANTGFAEDESSDNLASNLPETRLRLRLASTIISSDGKALAVIEDQVKRKQNIYKEGDFLVVKGQKTKVRVAKIERFQVILDRGGKQEVLKMFEKSTYTGRRSRRSRYSSSHTRRPSRTLPRRIPEEIPLMGLEPSEKSLRGDRRVRELEVRKTAKFYPVVEGSEVVGVRIRRVNPRGLYRRIGLIDGDIIQAVNGQPITDPADIAILDEILKNKEPVEVEIKRRNRIIKKTLQNY